jgi:transposase
VSFQEVAHLVRSEDAEIAKLQCSTERPDEQPQECSPDAERSRGDGPVCGQRRGEQGAAARQFNTTPKTVAEWVERFRAEGVDGLRDRSSRPLSLPSQTVPATCAVVEALRRQRYTGKQIAVETGVSAATVSRILRRMGLNRLRDLEPAEPVRRYERATPGEMIHIDIKKLGRFDKVGHPITGDRDLIRIRHARDLRRRRRRDRVHGRLDGRGNARGPSLRRIPARRRGEIKALISWCPKPATFDPLM